MKFTRSPVTNLVRSEHGTYYLRARICGRLVWKSLKTSTFTVAKLRHNDLLAELRRGIRRGAADIKVSVKMTFADAVELYRIDVQNNVRLKPRAKDFRLRPELTLRRTWPAIFDMELRRISPEACQAWQTRFEGGASVYRPPRAKKGTRPGNSPTTVNAVIGFLRHVFEIGIKNGVLYRNPATELMRKSPNKKLLRLPNRTQFAAIVAHVRGQFGWGRMAADLIEGLAYSGMRVGESHRLTWSHLDFEKNLLTIPGEKTENAPRTIPMTAAFRKLVETIKARGVSDNNVRVFEADSALGSLASACKKTGVPHLTHHDLRHLFATTCIESGVDVPTVALWLGHADGGALAMRTYGHIRPEHSIVAAKKVSFAPPARSEEPADGQAEAV